LTHLLWNKNKILKLPVTVDGWFGRLGNNIQQLALAILYAKLNELKVITPEHPNIQSIVYGPHSYWPFSPIVKNRFFFFRSTEEHPSDIEMSYDYICENISVIAQQHIAPNLKFQIREPLNDDVLVIHLRGGDIYSKVNNANPSYVQNPLSFYQALISGFNQWL
jgi:hypothetical protein